MKRTEMSPETIIQENEKYLESISETGVLTLASRFKRLTDLLFSQVQELFIERGVKFKSTWFSILLTLKHSDGLDIKTLAQRRRISHSAASQIIKDLEKNGMVNSEVESSDQRQKRITITEDGKKSLDKLIPQLKIVESTLQDILGEDFESFFTALDNLEYELNETPLKKRRLEKLDNIEIVPFEDSHRESFEALLRSWLEKYFSVEPKDKELFESPRKLVIDNGGQIFMALHSGKAVGVVSLIKHSDTIVELSKIGVDDTLQGRGIGGKLVDRAVEHAKQNDYKEMVIETDTSLPVSINLFQKRGFRDDPRKDHSYQHRGNIWLKKKIS